MVGEPRRHHRCPRLPLRGRAAAVGGLGRRLGQVDAGMRHTAIVVAMEDGHLLPQPVFALAQGADPSPDRRDMLTEGEGEPVTVDGGIAPSTSASKPCVPLLRHTAPQ
jgi:hypothetical protein